MSRKGEVVHELKFKVVDIFTISDVLLSFISLKKFVYDEKDEQQRKAIFNMERTVNIFKSGL